MKSGLHGPNAVPARDFEAIFYKERLAEYPEIDAYERRHVNIIDRSRLEAAAKILACPHKVNPPCWQHGRLIYSTLSSYLATRMNETDKITCVDIGTAKGFSALMMQYAIMDADALKKATVFSCDVIDPSAAVRRNTILEPTEGRFLNLYETVTDNFREAGYIKFLQCTGEMMIEMLMADRRINFAFVDGKHDFDTVANETLRISKKSIAGDVVIWDDVQIPGVHKAINRFKDLYYLEFIGARAHRKYCIGIRK
jgi:hypothetical protein